MTHGVWAHVQRNLVTFPRQIFRRIGTDLHYLNAGVFARSDVPLGSLGLIIGLIIFELGLPLTCTGTVKLFTKVDYKINKFQPLSKFLLSITSCILLEEPDEVLEAYGTRE